MEGFKTIKNQSKSVLTRHCNTLTRLLEEQDADGINDRLRSMKLTMEQLEQAHYDYLDCVQSNTSEDEDEISKQGRRKRCGQYGHGRTIISQNKKIMQTKN